MKKIRCASERSAGGDQAGTAEAMSRYGKSRQGRPPYELGGANVAFCCPMCKTQLTKLSPDAQVEEVFSDTAFADAFEVAKLTVSARNGSTQQSVPPT